MSLLETIFSLFLLALLIVFLLNLFPSAMYAVRLSEDRLQADELAQSALDTALSGNFSALAPSSASAVDLYGIYYETTLETLPVPQSDHTVVMALRATVKWKRGEGAHQVVHEVYDLNVAR